MEVEEDDALAMAVDSAVDDELSLFIVEFLKLESDTGFPAVAAALGGKGDSVGLDE